MLTELTKLERAHEQLLARVTAVLVADDRVTAAWLSGSYGRGETDAWSDLDLHVAVADEHFVAYAGEHDALFASCGEVIHVISHGIPSWSMPNGRFWLVQYAPLMAQVDWNLGPTTSTTIPVASHILFDRAGLPTTPHPEPPSEEFLRREAKEHLDFFWAMAPIAIKFTGRGHTRLAVQQTVYLRDAYRLLWRVLNSPELVHKERYHQNRLLETEISTQEVLQFGATIDPLAALGVIRAYCHAVEQLHPALAMLGVRVDARVVVETNALAEVAEAAARVGGSNPHAGSRR